MAEASCGTAGAFPFQILTGRSLAGNLTVSLALFVFTVVSIMSTAGYVRERQRMRLELEKKADEHIARITKLLALPMWNVDSEQIQLIGNIFRQTDAVWSVSISDQTDEMLFQSSKEADKSAKIRRVGHVIYEGHVLGRTEISLSSMGMENELGLLLRASLLTLLLAVVVIIISTGFLLVAFLRRPLEVLQRGMDEVAEGEYTGGLQKIRHVELRGIAQRFREMATRVQERERDLKEAYEIISSSPAVAIRWRNTKGWPVEFASRNVEELFGYTVEEWTCGAISYDRIIHPEDLDRVAAELDLYSSDPDTERFIHTPYRILTKKGRIKWVDDRTYIRRDAHGTISHFHGIVEDITARKETEAALRESEERFRSLFTLAPLSISIVDPDGRYVAVNACFQRLLGYTAGDVAEMDYTEVVHPGDREIVHEMFREMEEGKRESYTAEIRYIKKNGDPVWGVSRGAAVRDEKGRILFWIRTFEDVTERRRAEEELRAKTEEVDRFFTVALDLLCIADKDGYFRRLNPQWQVTLGYSVEELEGSRFLDLVHPDDMSATMEALQRLRGKHEVLNFANRYHCKDGSYRWIEWRSCPSGNLIYAAARDISERMAAEEALRQSEERFSKAFHANPAPMMITEIETGLIVDVNDRWLHTSGYTRDEMIGKTSKEAGIWDDPSARDQLVPMLLEQGSAKDMPIRLRKRSGELIIGLWSAEIVVLEKRRVLLSLMRDVTELKKAEEALRESETRFRMLVEQMPHAIVYMVGVDETRSILYVSPQIEKLMGFTPEEYITTPNLWQSTIHPDDRESVLSRLELSCREGKPFASEYRMISQDGRLLWFHGEAQLLRDEKQEPLCLIGICTDITELKVAQEELARHRDQLEDLVRERTRELEAAQEELLRRERLSVLGQLTATVSHELRNPLGVIRSSAYYLQKRVRDPDEKTRKHLNRIDEQVTRCDAIVEDLLEYTRGRHAEIMRGDINTWIEEVLMQMDSILEVTTIRDLSADLPPVSFDPDKLRRVMLNLLQNAHQAIKMRKATVEESDPPYEPCIKIVTRSEEGSVIVQVEDNGVGMDEETLGRALEPLFTTRARGTGLGLAIVQKIVQEHGGVVKLESQESAGTRVSVILPGAGPIPSRRISQERTVRQPRPVNSR